MKLILLTILTVILSACGDRTDRQNQTPTQMKAYKDDCNKNGFTARLVTNDFMSTQYIECSSIVYKENCND